MSSDRDPGLYRKDQGQTLNSQSRKRFSPWGGLGIFTVPTICIVYCSTIGQYIYLGEISVLGLLM